MPLCEDAQDHVTHAPSTQRGGIAISRDGFLAINRIRQEKRRRGAGQAEHGDDIRNNDALDGRVVAADGQSDRHERGRADQPGYNREYL